MFRIRNFLFPVALLVGAALLGVPASARATFEVTLSDGVNASKTTIYSPPLGSGDFNNLSTPLINGDEQIAFTFTYAGEYQVTVTAMTNTPGQDGEAFQTANTITVIALTPVANPLTIDIFADGYNVAGVGGVLAVKNSISTSAFTPNTPTDSVGSALSKVNGVVATPSATVSGAPGAINLSDATNGNVTLASSPFSLDSVLTISNLPLGGTANITWTTDATVTPAPGTLVLALSGLPLLGLGCWLKRRRVQPHASA